MENLLFDLYMAEVQVQNNYAFFSTDSLRPQRLMDYVLEKHGVTEAALDTSLSWYASNLEKYQKINERIQKRYQVIYDELVAERDHLEALEREREQNNYLAKTDFFFLGSADRLANIRTFRSDNMNVRDTDLYDISFDLLGMLPTDTLRFSLAVSTSDTTYIYRKAIGQTTHFADTVHLPKDKLFEHAVSTFLLETAEEPASLLIYHFKAKQYQPPTSDDIPE